MNAFVWIMETDKLPLVGQLCRNNFAVGASRSWALCTLMEQGLHSRNLTFSVCRYQVVLALHVWTTYKVKTWIAGVHLGGAARRQQPGKRSVIEWSQEASAVTQQQSLQHSFRVTATKVILSLRGLRSLGK